MPRFKVKSVNSAADSHDPFGRLQDDLSDCKLLVQASSSRNEQFLVSVVNLEPDTSVVVSFKYLDPLYDLVGRD